MQKRFDSGKMSKCCQDLRTRGDGRVATSSFHGALSIFKSKIITYINTKIITNLIGFDY